MCSSDLKQIVPREILKATVLGVYRKNHDLSLNSPVLPMEMVNVSCDSTIKLRKEYLFKLRDAVVFSLEEVEEWGEIWEKCRENLSIFNDNYKDLPLKTLYNEIKVLVLVGHLVKLARKFEQYSAIGKKYSYSSEPCMVDLKKIKQIALEVLDGKDTSKFYNWLKNNPEKII